MEGYYKIVLLRGIIFNFLIGNRDAHGKNFSLLYHNSVESLAPFYDILSTLIYSNPFKAKMAMKIGGKYKFREVQLRHWEYLSEITGFKAGFIKKQFLLLAEAILPAATQLALELNQNPKTASPIYTKIIELTNKNVNQF